MFYVYILQSVDYDRIYIGISKNPEGRLKQHNTSQTTSTKFYKPYRIIYTEKCRNRVEDRKREKYLKSGIGREWIKSNIMGH